MSKRTKAPWKIDFPSQCEFGGECADAAYRLNHDENQFPHLDEAYGNAMLMEAAPDLLDAAEKVLFIIEQDTHRLEEARALLSQAIAKAKGETR